MYVIYIFIIIDTAAVYRNETFLKEAFQRLLPRHDLERDDIFITTKLCKYCNCNVIMQNTISFHKCLVSHIVSIKFEIQIITKKILYMF